MGADSVEKIIEMFPHSTFTKQCGDPNYDKTQNIHKLEAIDAASIETKRGGGQHDYLAILVLTDAEYHTLKGGTFMPPTNLVPTLTIEWGMWLVETSVQQNVHKEHLRAHKKHKVVKNAVKQLVEVALEEK